MTPADLKMTPLDFLSTGELVCQFALPYILQSGSVCAREVLSEPVQLGTD